MRVYLAVAVLMLAFIAYTEAQDPSVEDRIISFRDQALETGRVVTEKISGYWDQLRQSEQVEKATAWGKDLWERIKNQVA